MTDTVRNSPLAGEVEPPDPRRCWRDAPAAMWSPSDPCCGQLGQFAAVGANTMSGPWPSSASPVWMAVTRPGKSTVTVPSSATVIRRRHGRGQIQTCAHSSDGRPAIPRRDMQYIRWAVTVSTATRSQGKQAHPAPAASASSARSAHSARRLAGAANESGAARAGRRVSRSRAESLAGPFPRARARSRRRGRRRRAGWRPAHAPGAGRRRGGRRCRRARAPASAS